MTSGWAKPSITEMDEEAEEECSNGWRKKSNLVYGVSDRTREPRRGIEANVLKALEGNP